MNVFGRERAVAGECEVVRVSRVAATPILGEGLKVEIGLVKAAVCQCRAGGRALRQTPAKRAEASQLGKWYPHLVCRASPVELDRPFSTGDCLELAGGDSPEDVAIANSTP